MSTKSKKSQKRRSLKIAGKASKPTQGNPFHFIPAIQLQGQWLQQAGFVKGARVQVEVSHRCIIIKPEKKANEYLLRKKSA